jgi:bifunctional pyridoxal-dependent enzyme with beta-cystathionase and maltose regulon repressor activities
MLSNSTFISDFVKKSQERLRTRYAETTATLDKFRISHRQSNAGFFLWADLFSFWSPRLSPQALYAVSPGRCLTDVALETRLNDHLLSHKVFVAAGGSFGNEEAGWFRITFALDREIVAEGLDRVIMALNSFELEVDMNELP